MTTEQRAQLPDLLSKGAEYYGFEGEVWTRLRVGENIQEKSSIGLLLKQLGLTRKQPTRRDYRQNLSRVAQWQEEILPELKKLRNKKTKQENQVIFYVDESAFYLLPQVRKTIYYRLLILLPTRQLILQ